jgi:peroxiredoxin
MANKKGINNTVSVRFPDRVKSYIKSEAIAQDITLSKYVRKLVFIALKLKKEQAEAEELLAKAMQEIQELEKAEKG